MSGTTISGVYLTGVTLNDPATQNPTTVAAGATVKASGTALAGAAGTYWTVANEGSISGTIGISLASGGSVSGGDHSSVYGSAYGVALGHGGSVSLAAGGSIQGAEAISISNGLGTVLNDGTVKAAYTGVYIRSGGSVTNGVSGSIVGQQGIADQNFVSTSSDGFVGVTNYGSISGGYGILLSRGFVTNAASGTIAGGAFGIMFYYKDFRDYPNRYSMVVNAGSISGHVGVYELRGVVSNAASGSISGINPDHHSGAAVFMMGSYGTVTNAGTLSGDYGVEIARNHASVTNSGTIDGATHVGVDLVTGGYVTNAFGASITGSQYGVRVGDHKIGVYGIIGYGTTSLRPGYGSIANSGSISGGNGVALLTGGMLDNSGTILGTNGTGIRLVDGEVSNEPGALVSGTKYGILAQNGTVLNAGSIISSGTGVKLNGGFIFNDRYETITGDNYGVTGSGLLINDGVIRNSGAGSGAGIEFQGRISNGLSASIAGGAVGLKLHAGSTVTNAGTISGGTGTAIAIYGDAASRLIVDPSGVFNGNVIGSATASNTLELAFGDAVGTVDGLGTSFVNFGSVIVDRGAHWELTGTNSLASGSTLTNSGTLALSGATLSDAGGIINNGKIELDPSTMNVANLTGTGTVSIDTGSTLAVQGAVSSGQDIVFSGSGGELDLATPLAFSGTLTGFTNGDIIDLTSVTDVAGSSADMDYTTNLLTVTENGTTYQFQFDKTETFAGDFFHLVSQNGGTVIEENQIACYRRGTLIAAAHGEVPVEALAIGDEIMTASGTPRPIKWIGRRSYHGRFILGRKDILPICFKAGSIDNGVPRRDLWISPHHAMYFYVDVFGGVLIEARELVNDVSIAQADDVDELDYFHIELDSHDVILAEGALSETFVNDDSRGMFNNVHEYALLYPETAPEPVRYSAPRIGAGLGVETVRQRLGRRAGLAAPVQQAGGLRGHVDLISACSIEGWAQNPDHPEAPVCLDIHADGRLIGRTLANRYREDLKNAGLGSGRHAFVFRPPVGTVALPAIIEVRRSFDGALLRRSVLHPALVA